MVIIHEFKDAKIIRQILSAESFPLMFIQAPNDFTLKVKAGNMVTTEDIAKALQAEGSEFQLETLIDTPATTPPREKNKTGWKGNQARQGNPIRKHPIKSEFLATTSCKIK